MSISKSGFLFVVLSLIFVGIPAKEEPKCEVCVDVLTEVMKIVNRGSGEVTPNTVRDATFKYCKTFVTNGKSIISNDDRKRSNLCFAIGAQEQSTSTVMGDLSKQLSFHKPPTKVCLHLNERDSQICEQKFDKPIEWATIDLTTMRVKQLKELLAKLKGDCKGCTEKSEYIARINELKPMEPAEPKEL